MFFCCRSMGSRTKRFLIQLQYYPELVFVVYLFGVLFSGPTLEQYLFKVFSNEVGYNYTYDASTANNDCSNDLKNSTAMIKLKEVQDKVSKFQLELMLALNVPPIILILFFGPIADRYGRKIVMIIAFVGFLCWSTIMTVVVAYDLDKRYIFIANFIWGCCGYYLSAVVAILAYVSDRTNSENRAFRIAVVDLVLFAAITTSYFSNGKYLQIYGFQACFMLMLIIAVVTLFCGIFFIAESLPKDKRAARSDSVLYIPRQVFGIVSKKRPARKKLFLLMVVDSTVGFTSPASVQSLLLLILLNVPFCWPSSWIGYYRGALFAIMGVGGVVAVKLLPLVMAKPFVIIVACLSSAGYLVAFSLSSNKWSAYVSILAGLFAYSAQPITRGLISQIVNADEQGSVFSVLGFFQTIVILVASLAYNAIYIYTNEHDMPSAVFIVASFTVIIPIIVSVYLYFEERKHVPLQPLEEDEIKEDKEAEKDDDDGDNCEGEEINNAGDFDGNYDQLVPVV